MDSFSPGEPQWSDWWSVRMHPRRLPLSDEPFMRGFFMKPRMCALRRCFVPHRKRPDVQTVRMKCVFFSCAWLPVTASTSRL